MNKPPQKLIDAIEAAKLATRGEWRRMMPLGKVVIAGVEMVDGCRITRFTTEMLENAQNDQRIPNATAIVAAINALRDPDVLAWLEAK